MSEYWGVYFSFRIHSANCEGYVLTWGDFPYRSSFKTDTLTSISPEKSMDDRMGGLMF